jgi:hypothetical protein
MLLQPSLAKGYYNQLQRKVTATSFSDVLLQPALPFAKAGCSNLSLKLVVVTFR